ncbi:MAG: alpha/beta fold hydrolase [Pseudoalteromonas sp.]|uniref:alpha/beta fold hydrolase n=1 Tax=unclassified Pseudoalteromonas TaxID=194690 RepID=UPI000C071378|nr:MULTISPECIES: alpha/beta hydrolase [unclassified Pseudoalteromonas]MDP2636416.1 alpha/beta hydrolase [Pseudoalteromonas sp. 1_MG-2023]PHN88305.1 sigma factor SigB regulation protein RsbQ [Pseudoalteromonas sp. 3D05]TGE79711.1 alpha/beta hydrolase [Pseudoalteromonas sp. KS88]
MPKDILARNNVKIIGDGDTTIMLAHGFGCDQNMWRFIQPMLAPNYKLVLFDYVGCGQSDTSAFSKQRYQSLNGYTHDVIEICEALKLKDIVFIGHSVSSIIGMLAAIESPSLFKKIIMVCPSPCFLNLPPNYFGGFDKSDLEELIDLMDKNYIGWANYLAPLVMGQNNKTELINELSESFCSTDPNYAKPFAKATFFSDDRAALEKLTLPTLILQSKEDNLASVEIGQYMHEKITDSTLEIINAHGHCLHMTDPETVFSLINQFLDE